MNSGLRRHAFTLGAPLVSCIGTHIRPPVSFCTGGAARACSGTRIGLLSYVIAVVTVPLIHAARTLGRNEAGQILNRAAVAGSPQ
jgi:hypothetical protein